MKFILVALFISLNVSAQTTSEPCRRGCWTPGQPEHTPAPLPQPQPSPREYSCDIEMVDFYNRALYIYTGIAESHKIACQIATQRCLQEVRLGYGGQGAKCWMIGK